MDNRRTILAVQLYRKSNIPAVSSQVLVEQIPDKFLDEAIKVYKEYGYMELVDFIIEKQNKAKVQS